MSSLGSGISTQLVGPPPDALLRPRQQAYTLMSLTRFAEIIHYSPMLFNQVYVPDLQPASSCSDPVLQYTWQPRGGGRPGRAEISDAIKQAEDALERHLGFPPAPRWVIDTDSRIPVAYGNRRMWHNGYFVALPSTSRIIEGGIEAWSLIQADTPVTYSDIDGDGYAEVATVSVTTAITNADEIALYYPGANRDPGWEIRPITVDFSGGVAYVRFSRHQAVRPSLLEELNATGVDGLDNSNFLQAVDVYRHYNSQEVMASIQWPAEACEDSVLGMHTHTASLVVANSAAGIVHLRSGEWNATTSQWDHTACPCGLRAPTSMRLHYRAGLVDDASPRPMHAMRSDIERAVAFLALSYLDREWQSCEQLHNLQSHWRTDLALRESSPSQSSSFQLSRGLLDNPFGTTRAAVFAWRVVQGLAAGHAAII